MLAKQASGVRKKDGILRHLITGAAAAAMLLAGSAAHGAFIQTASTEANLGLSIPNNTYDGSDESALTHTLNLAAPEDQLILNGDETFKITVAINHSRVGDLTIKLRSPDTGTEIFLMNRPGSLSSTDGGKLGYNRGSTAVLSAEFPITFVNDNAATTAHDIGNGLDYGTVGNASLAQFQPSYGAYIDGNQWLSSLAGEQAAGDWTLIVGDAAPENAGGTLEQWSLEVTTIPEPAAATLLAVGLALLASRRRRAPHVG